MKTNHLLIVLLMVAAAACVGGCSGSSDANTELPPDGPVAGEVEALLTKLRQAGADGAEAYMDEHVVMTVRGEKREALAVQLKSLALEPTLRILAVDRFDDVIRVRIKPDRDGGGPIAFKLQEENGQLKWLGPWE